MVRNIDPPPPQPAGNAIQITLPQQMTQKTLPLLERQVDDAIAQRAAIVEMLCGGVQLIDSAALNWLLSARARLEVTSSVLKLVDPSPIVNDIFLATRLESRFVIQHNNGSPRNA